MLELMMFLVSMVGFLGLLVNKDLLKKIISLDVMGTGVVSLFVVISSRQGRKVPIPFSPETADPLPQALIITAIVISFATISLLVVLSGVVSSRTSSSDVEKIEKYLEGDKK